MFVLDKGEPCVALSEVQAYARVETGEEEAILAGLLRVASEVCENFLGTVLLEREFREVVVGDVGAVPLEVGPVQSVAAVRKDGQADDLPSSEFAVIIDKDGRCWLSGLQSGTRYEVRGIAGSASDPNAVPEPIRQGILRLCVHMFANRDGTVGELPRAVTALWRPFRRAGWLR